MGLAAEYLGGWCFGMAYLIVAILCLQGIPKAPSQTISSCLLITHSKSWVMMVMGHREFLTGLDSATAIRVWAPFNQVSQHKCLLVQLVLKRRLIILIETCWKRPGMGICNHLRIARTCLQQRLVCGVKVPNSRKPLWLTLQLKNYGGWAVIVYNYWAMSSEVRILDSDLWVESPEMIKLIDIIWMNA
jgi:hypothetical protein